jgi:hypothetical protein
MSEVERELSETLVGYAYPLAEPVGQGGRRFLRRWVIRSKADLPDRRHLEGLGMSVTAEVCAFLADSYGNVATEEQLRESAPTVTLVPIAPRHCVVVIETPTPEAAFGDATAIGTWRTLRAVDNAIGIEDLEGIPRAFWFPLKTP